MESQPSFEQLIKEDRATRDSKKWRGSLLEYLELVRTDPTITKLAHSLVFGMFTRAGSRDILETEEPRVKRLYKDDAMKDAVLLGVEFFVLEKTITQMYSCFVSRPTTHRR